MTSEAYKLDKSSWGEGDWKEEPDFVEGEFRGVYYSAWRHETLGHWCGYAAVPRNHPWFGAESGLPLSIHGGVTFYGPQKHIAFEEATKDENLWAFGFDCGHFMDFSPGATHLMHLLGLPDLAMGGTYRNLAFVHEEVLSLARQLYESFDAEPLPVQLDASLN